MLEYKKENNYYAKHGSWYLFITNFILGFLFVSFYITEVKPKALYVLGKYSVTPLHTFSAPLPNWRK